jgi:hypothetical protein
MKMGAINIFFHKANTYPGSIFFVMVLLIRIGMSYLFGLLSKFIRNISIVHEMQAFPSMGEEMFMVMVAAPFRRNIYFSIFTVLFFKKQNSRCIYNNTGSSIICVGAWV